MKILAAAVTMTRKFIDIGANLTDDMYKGVYHGSKKHNPDLSEVLNRSWKNGLQRMIITGGSAKDSRAALDLAMNEDRLYATVGCHPTRCNEFESNPESYLNELRDLLSNNKSKVVAIGECGLDYDRLNFCSKPVQLKYFEYQLKLCEEFNLPLFLHCRAAADDLIEILRRNDSKLKGGVVHSFDGSEESMKELTDMGFYIGINGCSLRTSENLAVAAKIPADKLMIETDCPWCEIKPTHAGFQHVKTKFTAVKKEKFVDGSMVKGRNEPANIVQVLEILSGIRNEDADVLSEKIFKNTIRLFFKNDK